MNAERAKGNLIGRIVQDRIDGLIKRKFYKKQDQQQKLGVDLRTCLDVTEPATVLHVVDFTSVFVLNNHRRDDLSFAAIVELVTGFPLPKMGEDSRIRGVLGSNECIIDLHFSGNLLSGTIPWSAVNVSEQPIQRLCLNLVVMNDKEVIPIYIQKSTNSSGIAWLRSDHLGARRVEQTATGDEAQEAELLHAVPCYFIQGDEGGRVLGLRGPLAKAVEDNLDEDIEVASTLTPFCTPLEIEALAGWTLLRMMQLQEAPNKECVDVQTRFNCRFDCFLKDQSFSDKNEGDNTAQSEEPMGVYIPEDIKKLSRLQRNNRKELPVGYNEFREMMLHVKKVAEGHSAKQSTGDGAFLVNNSAICSLMDPHQGTIPVALKTSLFFSVCSGERKLIEAYHARPFRQAGPGGDVCANLFTKHRPSDKRFTIFSFTLTSQTIAVLERFEANGTKFTNPKYWYFVDEVTPTKNRIAATLHQTTDSPGVDVLDRLFASGRRFPIPPTFLDPDARNSLRERIDSKGFEIAPGIHIYVEDWPKNLRTASNTACDDNSIFGLCSTCGLRAPCEGHLLATNPSSVRANNNDASESRRPGQISRLDHLRHVTLCVGPYTFHSLTGCGDHFLRFIFDDWLKFVPWTTNIPS